MVEHRDNQLHAAVRAVHKFHDANETYPQNDNPNLLDDDVITCIEYAKTFFNHKEDTFNEEIAHNVARYARNSLPCMCALLGGIVAAEIIKYAGKYEPL